MLSGLLNSGVTASLLQMKKLTRLGKVPDKLSFQHHLINPVGNF